MTATAYTSPATMAQPPDCLPSEWAIVELLGHVRMAGRLVVHSVAGVALLRIEVPEVVLTRTVHVAGQREEQHRVIPAHGRSVPPSSIYAINWVDADAAHLVAHIEALEPITPFSVVAGLKALSPAARRNQLVRWADATDQAAAPGTPQSAQ